MPPYGEPDWATPGDTTNAVTQVAGTTVPVTAASGTNSNSGETRYVDPMLCPLGCRGGARFPSSLLVLRKIQIAIGTRDLKIPPSRVSLC
jgi:hypothetical protein